VVQNIDMPNLQKIKDLIEANDFEQLSDLLYEFDTQTITQEELDFLNELLLNPQHRSHQVVARILQQIKSPSSLPFVRQALDTHFDYLAYTCSEPRVIAQ
jgi:hypothetical protein